MPTLRSIICAQPPGVELGEAADETEAGIVDQQVDGFAVRFDVRHQLGGGVLLRQVDRDGSGVAELLRQLLQPILAPGRQHQPMPAFRQLAGELDAETG